MATAEGYLRRLTRRLTEDPEQLDVEGVFVQIGLLPNTEWLEGSGLRVGGGVLCDEQLAALGADGVWCAGDIAWAVTQFHGIYGPLACGDTTVMYEGTLDVPNHQRAWEIIARYGVEVLLTSPSVVRTIRGWAREMPEVSAVPTLRRVATAGEPVEEELAAWMRGALGREGLEVADAWGQLELGGIVAVQSQINGRLADELDRDAVQLLDLRGGRHVLLGDHLDVDRRLGRDVAERHHGVARVEHVGRLVAHDPIFMHVIEARRRIARLDQRILPARNHVGPAHVRELEPRVASGVEPAHVGRSCADGETESNVAMMEPDECRHHRI